MKEYLDSIMKTAVDYGYPGTKCTVLLKHCIKPNTINVPIQNALDNLEVYQKEYKVVSFTIISPPVLKKFTKESESKVIYTEESE